MSGKKDQVLEDTYAKKATNFKNDAPQQHQPNAAFMGAQQMQGLESDLRKQKEEEEKNKPQGLLQRKMNRIFGAAGEVKQMFFTGFKMGFAVGGIFGGLIGTYYAVVSRQFLYVPMAALGSGASFGFFMGIGMVMRTEMEGASESCDEEYGLKTLKEDGTRLEVVPIFLKFTL